MLQEEILGRPYSKTEHRRALQKVVRRSDGSIEFKHQNVSAVLRDLGHPWIDGYKPASNYQRSLLPLVVAEQLAGNKALRKLVEADLKSPVDPIPLKDILKRIEKPPTPEADVEPLLGTAESDRTIPLQPVDYLEREVTNSAVGLAGEEFVLRYEQARLIQLGREMMRAL